MVSIALYHSSQSTQAGFQIDAQVIALSANQIGPEGNLTNQSANCLAST